MAVENSKARFSDRAEVYKKYRPTYPPEVVSFIKVNCAVDRTWAIADIGSGTGISSRLLASGLHCPVFAVEPNDAMRKAAEDDQHANPYFCSIKGSAEETALSDESVNLVTAFQAFHWFDPGKARSEFLRILKPPKWVLFVWNDRVASGAGFLEEYEHLLRGLPQYKLVNHRNVSITDLVSFLNDKQIQMTAFSVKQPLDWEGLVGRFSSSSYTPKTNTKEYDKVTADLKAIFEKYNSQGMIELQYNTQVYLGKMTVAN